MKNINITIVCADDGSIIGTDDALAYESHYCDRCANQKPDEDGGCPAYALLVTFGILGFKEQAVQDILRMFFPPHPTAKGKLDQCRMFVQKKVCRDCQHWHTWDDTCSPQHSCDKVEENADDIRDSNLPVIHIDGDTQECWLCTDAEYGCPNWEERSDDGTL